MDLRILIFEESDKDDPELAGFYAMFSKISGYEHHVCDQLKDLPRRLETFKPHVVFWMLHSFKSLSYLKQIRQQYEELKIITVSEIQDAYFVELVDYHIVRPSSISTPEDFQSLLARVLGIA